MIPPHHHRTLGEAPSKPPTKKEPPAKTIMPASAPTTMQTFPFSLSVSKTCRPEDQAAVSSGTFPRPNPAATCRRSRHGQRLDAPVPTVFCISEAMPIEGQEMQVLGVCYKCTAKQKYRQFHSRCRARTTVIFCFFSPDIQDSLLAMPPSPFLFCSLHGPKPSARRGWRRVGLLACADLLPEF